MAVFSLKSWRAAARPSRTEVAGSGTGRRQHPLLGKGHDSVVMHMFCEQQVPRSTASLSHERISGNRLRKGPETPESKQDWIKDSSSLAEQKKMCPFHRGPS